MQTQSDRPTSPRDAVLSRGRSAPCRCLPGRWAFWDGGPNQTPARTAVVVPRDTGSQGDGRGLTNTKQMNKQASATGEKRCRAVSWEGGPLDLELRFKTLRRSPLPQEPGAHTASPVLSEVK